MLSKRLEEILRSWIILKLPHCGIVDSQQFLIDQGEDLPELAEHLAKILEAEHELSKKKSNLQLVRANLQRQLKSLYDEEQQLRETCPHLFGVRPISDEKGEGLEYVCETCGEEVNVDV